MTYMEALGIITKRESLGIVPGLARIYRLLEKMGNPQNELKIIHIAGTNGKGTVSAMLADAITRAGFTTGLFTSPWVTDYREQIQIDGAFISKKDFSSYIEKYRDNDCTEFEFLTAVMYKYFFDRRVDYAVVECGMGGLEDATNAICTPELAVITSVSVDHTNFLGDTLDEIALNKAGIIKKNGRVVLYPNPKTHNLFQTQCKKCNSVLYSVDDAGDSRLNNIRTVKTALDVLGIRSPVKEVALPARQEYIGQNIMLDGAHNPDGIKALIKHLPKREITAVIGMMRDKNVRECIKMIAPLCKKIITTTPSNPRAMIAQELKAIAKMYCKDVEAVEQPIDAVHTADYDFLLVCGSFYLARDVRKELLPYKM